MKTDNNVKDGIRPSPPDRIGIVDLTPLPKLGEGKSGCGVRVAIVAIGQMRTSVAHGKNEQILRGAQNDNNEPTLRCAPGGVPSTFDRWSKGADVDIRVHKMSRPERA